MHYENFLRNTYNNFNNRNIDETLSSMHKDVAWPNGMEGGIENGHDAVRAYWTRQWQLIDPNVEPLSFAVQEDGRIDVTVNQVVRDMEGGLLSDQLVHHIYTIKDGLISGMEILEHVS